MTRGEDDCAGGKDYRAEHDAAEKKESGRDYRERARAEDAVFADADNPNKAVRRDEDGIEDEINS